MHRRRQQPGFHGCNSQPILWKRQQQRGGLRRSASLVLKPLPQTPAVEELPGLEDAVALFTQCPGRLERCCQRLSAAEGELERLHHLSKAELLAACSTSAPLPKRDRTASNECQVVNEASPEEFGDEFEPEDVEDSGDSDMEPWGARDSMPGGVAAELASAESQITNLGNKAWNIEMDRQEILRLTEETTAQLAASKARQEDIVQEMNVIGPKMYAHETEIRTLRANISASENQVEALKKKLHASTENANGSQGELVKEGTLENGLHVEVTTLHSSIFRIGSELEEIKYRLTMVEMAKAALEDHKQEVVESHARHRENTQYQMSNLQNNAEGQEEVTKSHIAELQAQVSTSESDVNDLRQKLVVAGQGQEALDKRVQSAKERDMALEQECTALKERLQRAQSLAAKHAEEARLNTAKAQADLEEAQQAISAREADFQKDLDLRDAEHLAVRKEAVSERRAAELAQEFNPLIARLHVPSVVMRVAMMPETLTKPREGPPEKDTVVAQESVEDEGTEGFSNLAPIPELVFVSELGPAATYAGALVEDKEAHASRKPAKYEVDLNLNELRIQLLCPAGKVRRIPLNTVVGAALAPSSDGAVDIELVSSKDEKKTEWLRISPPDDSAASMLLGALSVLSRVGPGADLPTPSDTS